MSRYYLPDLSGVNTDYLKVNVPYFIYQVGAKIIFPDSPIFVNSLRLVLTDGSGTQLVKDVDWEVLPDDVDQQAMGVAFAEDNNFTKTLVRSVTIKSTTGFRKYVAMTFQEFHLTVPGRSFDDGTPLELTPELIKDIITSLADLRQRNAQITSPVTPNHIPPTLLPFDVNKTRAGNRVTNEPVTVNTVAGAKVIRFRQGAFFADSVALRFNGAVLNPAQDYTPIVLSPLTQQSTNKSGIYQYILINGTFAGELSADYHPVGGEVQIEDVGSVYNLMVAIKTYLNEGVFITANSIPATAAFRAMHARMNSVEEKMRNLLTGGPTYGDSSSGTAVTRPIGANDSNFHWWTIANLYQVEGSNDIIRTGRFKGRVYLPTAKVSLTFTVEANFDQTRNYVSFDTESVVFDPTYVLFGDVSVNAPQFPMIRVVWNQSAETFSGACIQFGIPLNNLTDVMVVEDMSTVESCWILDRSNERIVGQPGGNPSAPQDNGFLLPDSVSLWSNVSGISRQQTYIPEFDKGYLAYSGSTVSLDSIDNVGSNANLFPIVLPDYFSVGDFKTLVVTFVSADSDTMYEVEIPLTGSATNRRVGRSVFVDSNTSTFSLTADVGQDVLSDISISLNAVEVAKNPDTDEASDKTDFIRYIRVKV